MPQFCRLIPAVVAFASLVLFEIVYFKPSAILWVGIIFPVIFFIAIVLICSDRVKEFNTRWRLLIAPVLLAWSALAFSLLVETGAVRQGMAVLVAALLVLFFESVIAYVWRRAAYSGYSLENFSSYALTFVIFLSASVLLGLKVLLDINSGLAALGFLAIVLLVSYEGFFTSGIMLDRSLLFIGTINILLLELFLVFLWLPIHYMVSGAVLTVFWHAGFVLSRAYLQGFLTKNLLQRHLLLSFILIAILFSAAKWI